MPTYQYACTECGDQLEVVQKFSDDPLTVCPHCQGRLRKVFSPVGVVFKGSGFYKTDSRSKSASGSAGSGDGAKNTGSGDKADKSTSSTPSTDTKPSTGPSTGSTSGPSSGPSSSPSGDGSKVA